MEMRDEKYTNVQIKNVIDKGAGERFLWHVCSAVIMGFLAAVLWGFTGLPAPDSAHRGDFTGAKIFKYCADKTIPGC